MGRVLPTLFNTDMVRAILDGRKTATRRAIKKYILDDAIFGYTAFTPKGYISCRGTWEDRYGEKFFKLPCQKGDILYARETFRPLSEHPAAGFDYAANWSSQYFKNSKDPNACNKGKWKPSIHMPKKAARIWLKVTNVRVERLQDITNEQILKEGISKETVDHYMAHFPEATEEWIHAAHWLPFSDLWNSTVKKDFDLYSWDANPWVWVIEFERCEKPEEN